MNYVVEKYDSTVKKVSETRADEERSQIVTDFRHAIVSRIFSDLDPPNFERLEQYIKEQKPRSDLTMIKGIPWSELKFKLVDPAFNNLKFFVSIIQ